jgi:hypothetical protein
LLRRRRCGHGRDGKSCHAKHTLHKDPLPGLCC